MTDKKFCDICGAEIPETVSMEHNVAALSYSGQFLLMSGVMLELDDLCTVCAHQVQEFIKQLKKQSEELKGK